MTVLVETNSENGGKVFDYLALKYGFYFPQRTVSLISHALCMLNVCSINNTHTHSYSSSI